MKLRKHVFFLQYTLHLYLGQRLHVEGSCLREYLTNLLTSRLRQRDMNNIKLNIIRTFKTNTFTKYMYIGNLATIQRLIPTKVSNFPAYELIDCYIQEAIYCKSTGQLSALYLLYVPHIEQSTSETTGHGVF